MYKLKRGEQIEMGEWDGDTERITIWKRTVTGRVSVEINAPGQMDERHVEAGLKLARKIAAEMVE